MKQLSFSQAVEGYLLYAHSRRLSKHTVRDYQNSFSRLKEFLAPHDPPFASITIDQIEAFMVSLSHLSKKTLLNYHVGLSALWTWAMKRRVVEEHILRLMDPPDPEKPVIEIFTEEEVQKLLNACDFSQSYRRPGKRKCSNKRPTALRDKAIILTLLDSMVRVTELCEMLRSDMDLKRGTIKVKGKGDKKRVVPISEETADAIWRYLAVRPTAKPKYNDLVFLTAKSRFSRPLDRNSVGKLMRRLGRKVGVKANPHKFRHTGATQFLRNGGDVFTLKEILGHSTMEMVQRYVHLAQVDIEKAHRRASPVYNWDLRT